jgi:hypothetical protein
MEISCADLPRTRQGIIWWNDRQEEIVKGCGVAAS